VAGVGVDLRPILREIDDLGRLVDAAEVAAGLAGVGC
jgi:hypothetical protein